MITKQQILAWLRKAAAELVQQKAYLTDLDAAIGDADHGLNMKRGFEAARPSDWDDVRRARDDMMKVSKAITAK